MAIRKAEDETRNCTGFLFNICLSYGARQEIANACRQIAGEVVRYEKTGAEVVKKIGCRSHVSPPHKTFFLRVLDDSIFTRVPWSVPPPAVHSALTSTIGGGAPLGSAFAATQNLCPEAYFGSDSSGVSPT